MSEGGASALTRKHKLFYRPRKCKMTNRQRNINCSSFKKLACVTTHNIPYYKHVQTARSHLALDCIVKSNNYVLVPTHTHERTHPRTYARTHARTYAHMPTCTHASSYIYGMHRLIHDTLLVNPNIHFR